MEMNRIGKIVLSKKSDAGGITVMDFVPCNHSDNYRGYWHRNGKAEQWNRKLKYTKLSDPHAAVERD